MGEDGAVHDNAPPTHGGTGLVLAQRLTRLLAELPGPNGEPWTHARLAQALTEMGIPTTRPYITLLCSGERDNPNTRTLTGIAEILGVPISYFFGDPAERDSNERIANELSDIATLRSEGVHRLAMRARGVSPTGLKQLEQMLDYIRAAERLPKAED